MKQKLLHIFLLFVTSSCIFYLPSRVAAQNIAINSDGSSPASSALLDLQSTTKGLLAPRMTTTQRTAVSSPATGLLVYDTDLSLFYYYSGATWVPIQSGTASWTVSGNNQYSAVSGNVGIGTTSPASLFQVNGGNLLVSGTYGSGTNIEASGAGSRMFFSPASAAFRSGYVINKRWDSANIGSCSFAAGYNTQANGLASFAAGRSASSTGSYSFAAGYTTFATGSTSFAAGYKTHATGTSSIAIGDSSLAEDNNTVAIGFWNNVFGQYSIGLGYNNFPGMTGNHDTVNIAIGSWKFNDGNYSIGIGSSAGDTYTSTAGDSSITIGIECTTNGTSSMAMGYASAAEGTYAFALGVAATSYSYAETSLGANNTSYTSNSSTSWDTRDRLLSITNGSNNPTSNALTILKSGYTGIGNNTPASMLEVNGTFGLSGKTDLTSGSSDPDNTASIWIYSSNGGSITLPGASTCTNRTYTIINQTGGTLTISSYQDLTGTSQTSLATGTALWIFSNGSNWYQTR